MVPGGQGGATIGKTIFLCVYIVQKQQAIFNKTWYKLSLGKGNSKLYKSRARSFSKGR
jgi:hypothetical protein